VICGKSDVFVSDFECLTCLGPKYGKCASGKEVPLQYDNFKNDRNHAKIMKIVLQQIELLHLGLTN